MIVSFHRLLFFVLAFLVTFHVSRSETLQIAATSQQQDTTAELVQKQLQFIQQALYGLKQLINKQENEIREVKLLMYQFQKKMEKDDSADGNNLKDLMDGFMETLAGINFFGASNDTVQDSNVNSNETAIPSSPKFIDRVRHHLEKHHARIASGFVSLTFVKEFIMPVLLRSYFLVRKSLFPLAVLLKRALKFIMPHKDKIGAAFNVAKIGWAHGPLVIKSVAVGVSFVGLYVLWNYFLKNDDDAVPQVQEW